MRQLASSHSYEELRGIVVDILTERERVDPYPNQYRALTEAVGKVLARRGSPAPEVHLTSHAGLVRLTATDLELVRDVFWDLFRQGFITLGMNDSNAEWPWFRLSHHGVGTLNAQSPYRFHDSTSYLQLVRSQAPGVSPSALDYLDEAVATYYSDCLLASCVMLGIAAEVEFIRMIQQGAKSSVCGGSFAKADKESMIRKKIIAFQKAMPSIPKAIIDQAGEDFDTHLNAIQSVLRIARNEVGHGHPTALSREQVYVYLQMFVPFIGYVERLRQALV